ncbi:hypothetical protein LTR66_000826 [Elasticomyces elasticus]|nr:hypothetical protein LTR28_003761 [Elasticomyces elasticus]KAK5000294.1 hypothetical protein LTR66_000826 [Elasticomyces elasticus]
MFYQGDLPSGIQLAIQEQKLVACFIRQDNDYWSTIWEDYWLANESIHNEEDGETLSPTKLGDILGTKAVLLRIDMDSQEANFLSAFCPITQAPTLVVIHNGQLVERLEAGIEQTEFIRCVLALIDPNVAETVRYEARQQPSPSPSQPQSVPDVQPEQATSIQSSSNPPPAEASQTSTSLSATPQLTAVDDSPTPQSDLAPSSTVQSLLAERSARLEAERVQLAAAEKAARIAKAKVRREAAEKAQHETAEASSSSGRNASRQGYLEQQRQRQKEAKLERERILKTIESDRVARREKEEQRRALARAETEAAANTDFETKANTSRSAPQQPTSPSSSTTICSLQIRLFSGASIRGRFAPDSTLHTSVRTWIDSQPNGSDVPYTFRQILTPSPNRTITISEEERSLQELGLMPSATLVLVPVHDYTEAYASGGITGLLSRGLNAGYGLVAGGFEMVSGAFVAVTGYGRATEGPYVAGTGDEVEPSNTQGAQAAGVAGTATIKVRTLADQRAEAARDQREFYNGNQLNFEPRKDDDDPK